MPVKPLRIACWNSRGFSAATPYLRELLANHDILAVSEHWLHANRLNKLSEVDDNFNVIGRSCRHARAEDYGSRRGQGGVCIFWRKDLTFISPIKTLVHDRICGIRAQISEDLVINIYSVYLPAAGSCDDFEYTLDELSSVITNGGDNFQNIVCGDFNGDITRCTDDNSLQYKHGRLVRNFVSHCNFTVANCLSICSGPSITHVGPTGSSLLDYIMVPSALVEMIAKVSILDEEGLNTSDHNPISMYFTCDITCVTRAKRKIAGQIKWDKLSRDTIFSKYVEPLEPCLIDICNRLGEDHLTPHDLDEILNDLIGKIKQSDRKLPRTKYRPHIKPYWCNELDALKREKVMCHRAWKSAGRPRDAGSPLYTQYKISKKAFIRKLRQLARDYENNDILETIRSSEVNRDRFWKKLRKARSDTSPAVFSIKDPNGKVHHDQEGVLRIWKNHFNSLGQPKEDIRYDNVHYDAVNDFIRSKSRLHDVDMFLDVPFDDIELIRAISKLKLRKAPGPDNISAEHVSYAGPGMVRTLTLLYNYIIKIEYIPKVLRRGIQIPLYKGKDLCNLDPNSYRGITLLSIFAKIFEMILWARIEPWWENEGVISRLQGACRKGHSCVHTALTLQEALATSMETSRTCFVSYFDVSKAFDSVWIEGLFYRLYDMGITGKTWRLLFLCYNDFQCQVRVMGSLSDPYYLKCGIHQGGFMSLLKYIAFINSLLDELEASGSCVEIYKIPASPVGYADDLAAVSVSKRRADNVIDLVYKHSTKWRYDLNADKSAVLVYGEDKNEGIVNSINRNFMLGNKRIKERKDYDHVGVKACILPYDDCIIEGRLKKARRAFNASMGLGIRKNGLTVATCNIIFWMVIIPILTYGCELWVLSASNVQNLELFHRYAGRRVQRLHSRSPTESCYNGIGWISIERYIQVKKMLYIRTILKMDANAVIRKIFESRFKVFMSDIDKCTRNQFLSPIFDMLSISIIFDLLLPINNALQTGVVPGKQTWSKIVWTRAWRLEDNLWASNGIINEKSIFRMVCGASHYISWWSLADMKPHLRRMCEVLVKIVCSASMLKSDDFSLKGCHDSQKFCTNCDLSAVESPWHIIMQCPFNNIEMVDMYDKLGKIDDGS